MRLCFLFCLLTLLVACGKCSNKPVAEKPVPFPSATAEPAAAARTDKPNIVIVAIDSLRADHLDAYGYARATAPQIMRLAKDGITYEQAFATHTSNAPAIASILTGAYPGTHGVLADGVKLKTQVATLAETLREAGYTTGAFVSGWQLARHSGLDRGFEVYDAAFETTERSAAETWKLANRWVKKAAAKQDKPFFLFLHLAEPRFPYAPSDEYALRFLPNQTALNVPTDPNLPGAKAKRRFSAEAIAEHTARYDGEITLADDTVGKMVRALTKLERLDNTLLIVTGSHGETLFERGWIADHGGSAYEEQTHVPLVVRVPNKTIRRKRYSAHVNHTDIVSTVLEVADVTPDEEPTLAGRSLILVAEKKALREDTTRPLFTQAQPDPTHLPEISARLATTGTVTAVRVMPFKLIEYPLADGSYFQQLFNLQTDPGETTNVANANAERVTALHAELEKFRKQTATDDATAAAPTLSPEAQAFLKQLGQSQ